MNCRREKIRKKPEQISLNKVGAAKMVLEAPGKEIEICCCIE